MDREPTADERAGIDWWNGLSEGNRKYWMMKGGDTGVVADAWAAYQRGLKHMPRIELTVSLTEWEAKMLAQLMKNIGFSAARSISANDDEAFVMLRASEKVHEGLSRDSNRIAPH
jgi:hypothetical protein